MARVVVFGSINLDIIVPVPRLPVAGETLLGGDALISAGGKGANQAHAARLAGVAVTMVGRVGQDGLAESALALLTEAGVDLTLVGRSDRATGCATIWTGQDGSSTIVVSPGANADVAADDVPDALLRPGTVLVMQHEVPLEENARLIARAKTAGVRTILNAAPAGVPSRETLRAVDTLVVNEIELQMLCERLDITGDDLPAALAASLGTVVIATYGAGGVVRTDGAARVHVPACEAEVVDTTGAGDTFVGVFAACLARGMADTPALEHANAAAALCCARRGAQVAQPVWDAYAS